VSNYSHGYSGFCWGLNMKWASNNGAYDENTPFITATPYALEALVSYQDMVKDDRYLGVITSIFDFINADLHRFIDSPDTLCLSYSPVKEFRPVMNANSYAMYALSLLVSFLPDKSQSINGDILRLYHFISSNQCQDGSWWYYSDKESNNFIDCFHSCFVLKNLIKTSKLVQLPANCNSVVSAGYSYLIDNFIDSDFGLFKRFSRTNKIGLVKFDLYDNAEMLNLSLYDSLEQKIKQHFVKGENIYSLIDIFNVTRNPNMLRWAVMPYVFALSNKSS